MGMTSITTRTKSSWGNQYKGAQNVKAKVLNALLIKLNRGEFGMQLDITDTNLVPSDVDWELGKTKGSQIENWDLEYEDLEIQLAHEKFAGKTISEIMPFILESGIGASMYFLHMPSVPFRYYFRAYQEILNFPFVNRIDISEVSETATYFIGIITTTLRTKPEFILPIMDVLMPTVEMMANHQNKYDYAIDQNGVNEIRQLYEQQKVTYEPQSNENLL